MHSRRSQSMNHAAASVLDCQQKNSPHSRRCMCTGLVSIAFLQSQPLVKHISTDDHGVYGQSKISTDDHGVYGQSKIGRVAPEPQHSSSISTDHHAQAQPSVCIFCWQDRQETGRARSTAICHHVRTRYSHLCLLLSMLNKMNHKHAAYTCSGISVNIVVKLCDHVTYYSIHDVAVSFME
jgi:hypothetical protein